VKARARALTRLALVYARHAAVRVVRRPPQGAGLRQFQELYSAERLTEITPEERSQLPDHGLCVACGLCNFAAAAAGYLRSERLPLQLTRHLPDLWVLRDAKLSAVDFGAGAAVCPMNVPLPAMRDLVSARLARDGLAPPPTRGVP
jgi:ferredoxin